MIEARVFDALIGNPGRSAHERLFIPSEGRIALVDHERAFPTTGEITPTKPCNPMPPDLVSGLIMLEREELRANLGDYLSREQIDAMLQRRDRILESCQKQ